MKEQQEPKLVSIPYGKGKGRNAWRPEMLENVSIPYGKGKGRWLYHNAVVNVYQFPMGKVKGGKYV